MSQVDLLTNRRTMQRIVDAVAKVVEGAGELRDYERRQRKEKG
jgi:hypothetical protein